MTQSDFRSYIKFFQYLHGKRRFSYEEFESAYVQFCAWANGEDIKAREYLRDAEALLQFYYDVNVIGYAESVVASGETYYHWSYRERSPNDIAPKVKASNDLIVNPGIAKALDIGTTFQQKKKKKPAKERQTRRRGGRGNQSGK